MEKTLKATLYYDTSSESNQAREILDTYQISYRGIYSNPDSNWNLPFIFIKNKSPRIKGIKEIENFAEEEFRTNIRFEDTGSYIKSIKDLWILDSLFGKSEIRKFIIQNNKCITKASIDTLFQKHPLKFYIDSNKSVLSSSKSELLELHYGKLVEIDGIDALKYFEIKKIEEAKEKGYAKR